MNPSKKTTNFHNSNLTLNEKNSQSMLHWILASSVLLFLFLPPFSKALFNGGQYSFERPIATTVLLGSVALILASIKLFSQWQIRTWREIMQVAVWLIPLSFLISFTSAASTHSAKMMLFISVMYATAFVIGSFLSTNLKNASILRAGLIGSAYMIVIFGFMNWFGDASLFGMINWSEVPGQLQKVYTHAVMIDSNGERLTSVFQYANTYAGYLIAVLLISLVCTVNSRKLRWVGVHSFLLVPILVSFLLTLSRGGIVVFPVVLLCILPFLLISRQILVFIHLILGAVATFLALNPVTQIGLSVQKQYSMSEAALGWGILLGASLAVAVVSVLVQKYLGPILENKLARWNSKRFSNLAFPIISIVLGSLLVFLLLGDTSLNKLLPDNIQKRIETINFQQHSVLERGTFYTDAMKVITDHPLIGLGGGAWSAVYEKYQNNPYTSRQAHNFYLQYAIEVGILGFIVLVAFLGGIFYFYIRHFFTSHDERRNVYLPFVIVAITLLIHSALDFNMSYVYLGILLFLCLGCMVGGIEFAPNDRWQRMANTRWNKLFPATTAIIALITLIGSFQLVSSGKYYVQARQAADTTGNIHQIFPPLDRALKSVPNHLEYNLFKIAVLQQIYDQTKDSRYEQELQKRIDLLHKKEPYNRQTLEIEYLYLTSKQDYVKALNLLKQNQSNYKWDISILERIIALDYQLGQDYWEDALYYYEQVQAQIEELKKLPEGQIQGREFSVTETISQVIEQINHVRGTK
jgi:hypothetical protein